MADVIGFDPVAWSVDGGRHPGSLLRVLAYAATNGTVGGVITPADCKVRQLAVAGEQISIDTGAVAIRNRSANVKNQTYIANAGTESRLDVQPTTPAGGRSDAVLVRIEDPDFSPWDLPDGADPATFQYTRPFVQQNVAADLDTAEQLNLGYAAELLARIDIPPSTAAITDGMIKDKRRIANPRNKPDLLRVDLTGADHYVSAAGWTNWPATAKEIDIPEWAAEMILRVRIDAVSASGSAVGGQLRAVISPYNGEIIAATKSTIFTERVIDELSGYEISDRIVIPASARGTKKWIYPQGAKWAGDAGGGGNLRAGNGTSVVYDYIFLETTA